MKGQLSRATRSHSAVDVKLAQHVDAQRLFGHFTAQCLQEN